jgi:hypothetical protein
VCSALRKSQAVPDCSTKASVAEVPGHVAGDENPFQGCMRLGIITELLGKILGADRPPGCLDASMRRRWRRGCVFFFIDLRSVSGPERAGTTRTSTARPFDRLGPALSHLHSTTSGKGLHRLSSWHPSLDLMLSAPGYASASTPLRREACVGCQVVRYGSNTRSRRDAHVARWRESVARSRDPEATPQ